ncbi:MAG: competence/damage-inducible protein A [Gemmatimonadaceae bacterium]|nr:competence/damage-inducible protein A [Gemmatimonadaceae bacterium]
MFKQNEVEIVTIGDELLLGQTVDTNAVTLARELGAIGISIVRRATVADTADAITDAVRQALARTGTVITTGGLGPTADDLTRPTLAALFGRALVRDESIVAALEALWASRGRGGALPASNLQQAMVPEGAEIVPNPEGTAPGLRLTDGEGRSVTMLPGVPRELRAMLQQSLVPWFAARAGGTVLRTRAVRTTSIAESALAERLGASKRSVAGLPLAYLPGMEGVDLRVTARDLPPDEAAAMLDEAERLIRDAVGVHAYATDRVTMPMVVLERCAARGETIAVAESCTGGLLGARLTEVPGSSRVLLGGSIAYHNDVKVRDLGVSPDDLAAHGAVSEVVALQMARGVRARTGASIGIAITGIAGPDGGTPDKPVGTVWIGIDVHGDARAHRAVYIGDRQEIRFRASQAALDLVRRRLLEREPVGD